MEVKVVSKETIKPSSPTPPNFATYKISLLDQFFPAVHIPAFLCYQSRTHNNSGSGFAIHEKLPQLKHAFSETLTRFYPLAGRVRDRLSLIDCNDAGAVFCTARVKGCPRVDELLKQLEAGEIGSVAMNRLLPTLPVAEQEQDDPFQVAVQLNFFDCGGVVIGVLFSHKIIDGVTLSCFLKCWAAIYSGSGGEWPNYSVSSLYPQREDLHDSVSLLSPINSLQRLFIRQAKGGTVPVATKRFLFDAAAIAALKSRCKSTVENPTSFQVLACFIWKHVMAASRAVSGKRRPSIFAWPMDLRRRMELPLPENTVGNVVWDAFAYCDEIESEELDLGGLMRLLNRALNGVKNDFVPKLANGYEAFCEDLKDFKQLCDKSDNINAYMYLSWQKLGFYQVDFGWGKPAKVGSTRYLGGPNAPKNGFFIIESGSSGDQIEVYINLDMPEMLALQNNAEFIAIASSSSILYNP